MQTNVARIVRPALASAERVTPRNVAGCASMMAMAMLLAGCSYNIGAIGGASDPGASAVRTSRTGDLAPAGAAAYRAPAPVAARDLGPVLGQDGACSQPWTGGAPATIEPGIAECALVAGKGAPVDVLIGGSGKGQREVQVLYQEPTGKKVYLFSDNRLVRIVD